MTLVIIFVSSFILRFFSPWLVSSAFCFPFLSSQKFFPFSLARLIGRFSHLVDSLIGMEGFRAPYHIPRGVSLWYCPLGEWHTLRKEGEVVIPMIAFIERGMRLLMDKVTRDYLIVHRICPHQCTPNLFKVLGSVDAFNKQMELGLTWHDVFWMYECYLLVDSGYYLKSRSSNIRLISCLPKSN